MDERRTILRVGLFNAVLSTVVGAVTVVLTTGIDTEGEAVAWHLPPTPFELAKAVLLLSPIAAVPCGFFGLISGLIGGSILYRDRTRVRSSGQYLMGAAFTGFLMGLPFIPFAGLVNRALGMEGGSLSFRKSALLAPAIGAFCGLLCAAVFRRRLWTQADTGIRADALRNHN